MKIPPKIASPISASGAGMTGKIGLNEAKGTGDFSQMLKQAITKVNDLQVDADRATESVLAGQTTDLHRVMIATEKANIALQLAIEVRNKVVSAYEEIMRMPV